MHALLKRIEHVAHNPHLGMIFGLIIMATGVMEAGDTLFEDVSSGDLEGHHGVILLGLAHAFKELPEVLAGLAIFARAEEDEHDKHH